jgi:tetratricopeptide (TPR) repeat protein
VVRAEGDYERATALASEALAFAQQTEDKRLLACSLTLLGSVARSQNDYERATALQEECLSIARELEDRWWVALTLGELAELAEYQGNDEQTIAFYQEQLALAHELVEKRQVAESLLGLASVAAGQGQPERAARLMGAIEAFCETTESPRPSVCGDLRNRAEGVRAVLGEPNFAAAWAVGRAMLLEEAIADALEPPDAAIGRPAP